MFMAVSLVVGGLHFLVVCVGGVGVCGELVLMVIVHSGVVGG